MSVKRVLPLVACALVAIAFAAPATAAGSPGKLVIDGQTITQHLEVHLVIHKQIETLGTGITCTFDAVLTTEDGTTATTRISKPKLTTNTCEYFGFYEGCEIVKDTPTGDPWVVHPDDSTPEDSFTVTDKTLYLTFQDCFFHDTEFHFPHVDILVDEPITHGVLSEPDPETGINEGTASGTLADGEPFELPVAASGTVTFGEWTTGSESGFASGTFELD